MRTKKSLTNLILLTLEKAVDGFVRIEDFGKHGHLYAYERPLEKNFLAQALKRLRERNLINFVDNDKLAYKLTDEGKQKAIWETVRFDDSKWDEKWRLVIFDIPEKRRQARNLLRESLKKWGFTCWQQSVWATKKNCTEVLRKFIKEVGIEDWVMVVESSNVGRYSKYDDRR